MEVGVLHVIQTQAPNCDLYKYCKYNWKCSPCVWAVRSRRNRSERASLYFDEVQFFLLSLVLWGSYLSSPASGEACVRASFWFYGFGSDS